MTVCKSLHSLGATKEKHLLPYKAVLVFGIDSEFEFTVVNAEVYNEIRARPNRLEQSHGELCK